MWNAQFRPRTSPSLQFQNLNLIVSSPDRNPNPPKNAIKQGGSTFMAIWHLQRFGMGLLSPSAMSSCRRPVHPSRTPRHSFGDRKTLRRPPPRRRQGGRRRWRRNHPRRGRGEEGEHADVDELGAQPQVLVAGGHGGGEECSGMWGRVCD
jgi:hypothetical protein